ncbi:MAG: S8 family serine peptidase [Nocardioides sp.]|uniref:S8 family serine peptidase n=1 Tax=Nocardioides sp. TaxID=35761 RepID=UPI003F0A671A
MIRRTLAAASAAALLVPLVSAAPGWAKDPTADLTKKLKPAVATTDGTLARTGPVISLGDAAGKQTYIVQLDQPAVPTRASATDARGRTLAKTPSAKEYRTQIAADQKSLKGEIAGIVGGTPKVLHTYTEALNGFAVELTRDQAARVAKLDGVGAVQVDKVHQLTTDHGPSWIGANTLWDGSAVPNGTGSKGEGIIAGIIDSGINPANPSFADTVPASEGGDGYDHTNPLGSGNYLGMCNPANTAGSPTYVANWGCNDKLIGYYNFTTDGSEYDDDGHGSHTGSTTAGNQVEVTTYSAQGTPHEFSTTETIRGVAPHANVIGYDVCDGGCSGAAIVAAIDQAIDDGVDVINYSIGSSSASDPWNDPDAVGFLNARAAGVHVATSAGNDGPGAATVGSPADVPWITSVGASQHDRQWQAKVTDITADGGATHADIAGVAFAAATAGTFPLVDGASLGSARCIASELDGQDLTGKIILCERGTNGRVEKGQVVRDLGAEGMVLGNDEASGDSLNADPHELPAVHITFDQAQELRAWMSGKTGVKVALSGGIRHVGDDVADIMAGFSSRGPNRAVSIISPSVSAPGVDILAAEGVDNEVKWGFISGTSMASPHTAGALALVAAVQPDWTPAEAQSALMTTAMTAIKDTDGSDADWHDMGSGRIDLTKVAKAGLVFDTTYDEYVASDPSTGGDVRTLNLASMADNDCLGECSWTRTATATDTGAGTWTAEVTSQDPSVTLSVDKSSFTVAAGESADLTVTADVSGAAAGEWVYGTLTLTPPAGSEAPVAHLPIGVVPSAAVLPDSIGITTRRDAGSQESGDLRVAADTSDVTFTGADLTPLDSRELSVAQDPTNDDAFNGDGVSQTSLTVPAGTKRLFVGLSEATAPDFDLYIGQGAVSADNVVAYSASGGSREKIDLASPPAGEYWVIVQNWEASAAGTDTVTLSTAVVGGSGDNFRVEGPSANVPAGDPFTVRAFWDEDELDAGETWYGAVDVAVGGDSVGVIPVTLARVTDDVTKTADVTSAKPGDTITYTVEVAPNVTPEDLEYTITDQLPDGVTYVEGSATGGATYADGTLTWTGTQPTMAGVKGSYTWTTSADDTSCVNPVTGTAGYFDLESELGIKTQAGAAGDTTRWTAFNNLSFGHYGQNFPGLSITDDGLVVRDAAGWGGKPWETQAVPNAAQPNNLNAVLWQDMEVTYDQATNKGLSLASDDESIAIAEWDDVHLYEQPSLSYDVQVIAQVGTSDIVYAYDNINGPLTGVTIGAEDSTGTNGQALVNKGDASSKITNGTVVCGTYNSADGEAQSFTYQVTVDADAPASVVNAAVHTVDNPGAKEVTASSTVTVEGGTTTKVKPTIKLTVPKTVRVNTRPKTVQVKVTAKGAAATGKVKFVIKGAGKRVVKTVKLNAKGIAKVKLPRYKKKGKVTVTVTYSGSTTVKSGTAKKTFKVVRR